MFVVVGIMILALVFMMIRPLLTPKPKSKTVRTSHETQNQSSTEIPFTQEGYLWFIDSKGDTLKKIELEIADNDFETQRGLMDRRSMKEDQGMLFIFDDMSMRSFWMKNTYIPLDIIFVTDKMEIESIQANTTPFSQQSVPSNGPAQYVVEVNAGFSQAYGIGAGTKIFYQRL